MKLPALLVPALAACVLSLANGGVVGAPADPTRPPSVDPQAGSGEDPGQAHVLQSVLIAPGRSNAVIDGKTVRVGGQVGEAKVVKIDETGVVLSKGGKMEMLKLFPFAQKTSPKRPRRQTSEEKAR